MKLAMPLPTARPDPKPPTPKLDESDSALANEPPVDSLQRTTRPLLNLVAVSGPDEDHSHALPWVQPVLRWKDHLVIDRYGPRPPTDRCCRCNEPARKLVCAAFYSCADSPLFLLTFFPPALTSWLPRRRRASIEFGLCTRCVHRRLLGGLAGLLLGLAAIALSVQALLADGLPALLWGLGAAVALVGGLVVAHRFRSLGVPKRIDHRWVILRRVGKPFLDSLPQSPIPQF